MKKMCVFGIALFLVLSGCALLGGGGSLLPVNTKDSVTKGKGFQPLEVGRSWLYTGKVSMFTITMGVKITGVVPSPDGKDLYIAAVKVKGPGTNTNNTVYFTEIDGAIKIIRTDTMIDVKKGLGVEGGEVGILYAPPKTVVKQGMKAGDTWTDTYTQLSNINIKVKTGFKVDKLLAATGLDTVEAKEKKSMTETLKVLGKETVTVPFGTFECLKVESHPNESQTFYTYYADGYGKIKEETEQDGKIIMSMDLIDMDSINVDNFFAEFDVKGKLEWLKNLLKK